MQHFTVLASTNQPFDDATRESVLDVIRRSLPFRDHILAESSGLSDDARVLYYWATNEPGAMAPAPTPTGSIVLSSGDVADWRAATELPAAEDLHVRIGQMTGRFCAAVVDLRTATWAAATTLARLDPVYYCDDARFRMVGTWSATLAALRHEGAHEDRGLASFLSAGHFYSDHTFYAGVRAMPPYATLRGSPELLNGRCDFFDHVLAERSSSPEFYDETAEALIRACRRLGEHEDPVTLSLSGGKDSRLLLAAMLRANVRVAAVTTSGGTANSADVYCAEAVARAAGVQHTVRALSTPSARERGSERVDFHRRTLEILRATDSQIISWGNMAFQPRNSGRIILNGLGGELLRGGYGKTADMARGRTTVEFLLSRALRSAPFLTEHTRAAYHSYLEEWLAEFSRPITVTEAADFGYLYFRLGRWASAQSRAGVLARRPTYPLLDNAFLTRVYSVHSAARTDDRLLYELLHRMHPALSRLPFANDAWRFEGPEEIRQIQSEFPAAFVARGSGSGENTDWRQNWTSLLPEFRRQICSDASRAALEELIDWEVVSALLDGHRLNHGHRFFLFAVYAAAIVLTDKLDGDASEGLVIDVPLGKVEPKPHMT